VEASWIDLEARPTLYTRTSVKSVDEGEKYREGGKKEEQDGIETMRWTW
jgi:hypothetical protein